MNQWTAVLCVCAFGVWTALTFVAYWIRKDFLRSKSIITEPVGTQGIDHLVATLTGDDEALARDVRLRMARQLILLLLLPAFVICATGATICAVIGI